MTPALVSYLEATLARHKHRLAGVQTATATDELAGLFEQLEYLRAQMSDAERAGVLLVDRLLGRYEP